MTSFLDDHSIKRKLRAIPFLFATFIGPGIVLSRPVHAQDATRWSEKVEPFLREYCWRCHGPERAEGTLRFDQVRFDMSSSQAMEIWHEILDKVESRAMPPEKGPLPSQDRIEEFALALSTTLREAADVRKKQGRTQLRRLNRVEFENTVNALFEVQVRIKEMLPDDSIVAGFDNVGSALTLSPVLIERYLEAADTVLQAATAPVHQLPSRTERFDLYESLPKWFLPGAWKQEEGVILFRNGGDSPSDLRQFKSPAPGRYRFRIRVSAHQSETPLPMAVLLGNFVVSGNPTRHLGYFDAPPGDPIVIEFEERLLAKNDTIKVTPVALPFVYLRQETMPEYPGPGLHIHWIEVEGPLEEVWPTSSYRHVYGDADPKQGTLEDAEHVLRELLPRAFRRPIVDEEVAPFLKLIRDKISSGETYEVALRTGIKAVLASPKFLYLREPIGKLDPYALASRLSYFLWSSIPDAELLTAAQAGDLEDPDKLRSQVERMLNEPKAQAFTENFTGQWLSLREMMATTPDKTLYPEHEELLQWSMIQETRTFFDLILRENLSIRNFLDSNFTMLNGRLAKHYGIPDVHGVAMRKVMLKPESHRGGVLTQASILKVTANGTHTSPVMRGVWILDHLLGQAVPPPPPNVPAVEPDIRGATSIREQLAKHRSTENCAGCHQRIDPLGFALENFDVIGGYRERYRVVAERKNWVNNRVGPLGKYLAAYQYGEGKPVESGDVLSDGHSFSNVDEFKKRLLLDSESFTKCLVEKLVTYATGEPVGFQDRVLVKEILNHVKREDDGLRTILHAIIQSELFRTK